MSETAQTIAPELPADTGKSARRRYSMPTLPGFTALGESSEEHANRLFQQILFSLISQIIALMGIFYFLLPLTDRGRDFGGTLLWTCLAATVSVTLLFFKYRARMLCANLLLAIQSTVLVGSSFLLGGVMSPTMIFLLAMPVMAATLMNSRWVFTWTAVVIACWLGVLVMEFSGVRMLRITEEANIGPVQVLSLLGTSLIVMSVLGSYLASNSRLRVTMENKAEYLDFLANHDPLTAIPNRRAFFSIHVSVLKTLRVFRVVCAAMGPSAVVMRQHRPAVMDITHVDACCAHPAVHVHQSRCVLRSLFHRILAEDSNFFTIDVGTDVGVTVIDTVFRSLADNL